MSESENEMPALVRVIDTHCEQEITLEEHQLQQLEMEKKKQEIEKGSQIWRSGCIEVDKGLVQYGVGVFVVVGGLIFSVTQLIAYPHSQIYSSMLTFLVGLVIPMKN